MRTTPPSVDHWAESGDREHLVQFYEDSQALVDTLDGFIGSGLLFLVIYRVASILPAFQEKPGRKAVQAKAE